MRIFPLCILVVFLGGCVHPRPLPRYERPIARTHFQYVRTTSYTSSESDHRRYGARSAMGTRLRYDSVHSAAADWARWPAGTLFRIVETGEVCQVDDYGWALSGTNTIDIYKPTRAEMNRWATRRVHIEILQWGDPWRSYRLLKPVKRFRHVQRMMWEIKKFY